MTDTFANSDGADNGEMFTQQTTCFLGSCFLSFTVFCVFSTTNKCLHQHHCHVMMCHHMLIEITMTKCRGNDEEELRILDYLSLTGVCSRLSVILQDIHTGICLIRKLSLEMAMAWPHLWLEDLL